MRPQRPFWRRRLLPVFAVLLALNLLALVAWTLPRGYRQRNALSRAAAIREEAGHQRTRAAQLRQRAAAIRSNSEDLRRFYAKRVGSAHGEVFETVAAVEAMVRGPGLKPGARAIAPDELDGAPLEQVKISLPLEGSYSQLVGFLRQVEASPRFLTVDGISLHAERTRGAALEVVLSMYLKLAPDEARKRGGRAR